MKRNVYSLKLRPIKMAILIMLMAVPASAQAPVEVKVNVKGDVLIVDAVTKSAEPSLRMNPDPAFLELSFPNSKLSGAAFSKAIDKGLIRKVVTAESGTTAIARIYVLSKPKANLVKTDSGFRYTVGVNELAGAPKRVEPAAASSEVKPPQKPVAVQPVTTPKPPEAPTPKTSPTVAPTPDKTKPVGPSAPITATFSNTPVGKAVSQMAAQAGLQSTIDPALTGTVTQSFTAIPFETALRSVLQTFGDNVVTTYANDTVTIRQKIASGPPPKAPATTVTEPPAVPGDKFVREYFPFKTKSAEKALQAAQLAFPNVSYLVDPVLNILMVEGSAEDVKELEKFLRAQSPK